MQIMTGGCQCGRVRYAARIDSDAAYLCHCGMCRRATGGVSIAFRNIARADVTWTTEEPDRYRSSAIAQRGFCRTCGTPLTFEYPDSDMMDLTIGSFDDPARFVPDQNVSIETILPAWLDCSHLPGTTLADHASTRDRWLATTGKLPD
ncbi:GFA family protein [Sphingomonas prati]|uniref:CENP-V/GFA domain-containing protein n=1 Tax=Sphingomonas prati TaxID=1843237 RepID=A0A7W9F0M7_9SPHN|nr:GFA family protein [Sphingomonas prati]MBB5728506.1 hypothetical protein [Sphingomonas prati]GGE73254.1 aldehyde-activating protein [Sphingomonas prati]